MKHRYFHYLNSLLTECRNLTQVLSCRDTDQICKYVSKWKHVQKLHPKCFNKVKSSVLGRWSQTSYQKKQYIYIHSVSVSVIPQSLSWLLMSTKDSFCAHTPCTVSLSVYRLNSTCWADEDEAAPNTSADVEGSCLRGAGRGQRSLNLTKNSGSLKGPP